MYGESAQSTNAAAASYPHTWKLLRKPRWPSLLDGRRACSTGCTTLSARSAGRPGPVSQLPSVATSEISLERVDLEPPPPVGGISSAGGRGSRRYKSIIHGGCRCSGKVPWRASRQQQPSTPPGSLVSVPGQRRRRRRRGADVRRRR